jgi:hypothetical protein
MIFERKKVEKNKRASYYPTNRLHRVSHNTWRITPMLLLVNCQIRFKPAIRIKIRITIMIIMNIHSITEIIYSNLLMPNKWTVDRKIQNFLWYDSSVQSATQFSKKGISFEIHARARFSLNNGIDNVHCWMD